MRRDDRRGLWGVISETRIGILAHDQGPFSSNKEDGVDINLDLYFVSPDLFEIMWSPRPHMGITGNSSGDTNQFYLGLAWEWDFLKNWFAGFSVGGVVHDGELTTSAVDKKELGCRFLFREAIEFGYRFDERHSIMGHLSHISNADICDKNEGLETSGVRYGYRF